MKPYQARAIVNSKCVEEDCWHRPEDEGNHCICHRKCAEVDYHIRALYDEAKTIVEREKAEGAAYREWAQSIRAQCSHDWSLAAYRAVTKEE